MEGVNQLDTSKFFKFKKMTMLACLEYSYEIKLDSHFKSCLDSTTLSMVEREACLENIWDTHHIRFDEYQSDHFKRFEPLYKGPAK